MSAPPFGASRLVQLPDVWHVDALAGTPGEAIGNTCERKLCWYLEDYAGNLVMGVDDSDVASVRERWGFADAHVVAWSGEVER